MSDMKSAGPAWSPDGKMVACASFSLKHDHQMNIELVDLQTRKRQLLNAKPWYDVSRLTWLADGSGLIVAATETPGSPWQLELIGYPSGQVRRVTNDPNNYTLVSGTRDSNLFLTLNTEEDSSVWQLAVRKETEPAVLTTIKRNGIAEIEWDKTGRFLYTINDGNHVNLWAQEPDGTSRQLTFASNNSKPANSPDNRYIVFASTSAGTMNIWRMNADGTQITRLTHGVYEDLPSVTADNRWVVYRTASSISKVSIDGGEAIRLLQKSALCPTLSPDGRLLAFFTNDKPDSELWHIEVFDLTTLQLVKRFELPNGTTPFNNLRLTPDNRLRWSPDGEGLSFVSHADGAANVWLQPYHGGAARQLTYFKDAEISSFAWSADGKQIACVRNVRAYVPMLVRVF
jgi:Tol biopolymer transport system component